MKIHTSASSKCMILNWTKKTDSSDSCNGSNGSNSSDGSGGSGAEESAPSSIVEGNIIDSINFVQEKMENEAMQLDVEDVEEENTLPPKIERLTILDPANWTDLNMSSIQKENSTPFFKLFFCSLYDWNLVKNIDSRFNWNKI